MMGRSDKKSRGMFVFPLQSWMTGARYPYMWMRMAQQRGWHMVLDVSALAPKDISSLGLSLIQLDFIICSFFKVFGENPSGFAGLFMKKSGLKLLEPSAIGRSIGVVSIVPARRLDQLPEDFSGTDSLEIQAQVRTPQSKPDVDETEISGSYSGSIHSDCTVNTMQSVDRSNSKNTEAKGIEDDSSVGVAIRRLRMIVSRLFCIGACVRLLQKKQDQVARKAEKAALEDPSSPIGALAEKVVAEIAAAARFIPTLEGNSKVMKKEKRYRTGL